MWKVQTTVIPIQVGNVLRGIQPFKVVHLRF